MDRVGCRKVEVTWSHEFPHRLFLVLYEVYCRALVKQLLKAPTPYRHDNTRLRDPHAGAVLSIVRMGGAIIDMCRLLHTDKTRAKS